MSTVHKTIDVDVPVRVAYDQWTQFEDFPRFMEGVEEVEQLDDTSLRWHVNIAGVDRTFMARIEDQEPDRRIAWRATEGERQAGTVTFEPMEGDRTRVGLELSFDPADWQEKAADALTIVDRRIEGDLQRFKGFIEERGGDPTGAWRGEVEHGRVEVDDLSGGAADGQPRADLPPRTTTEAPSPGSREPLAPYPGEGQRDPVQDPSRKL